MILPGFLLLAILTFSDGAFKDCDHCNKDGPWWPLFKPSQLISSEFPEHNGHTQYRSHEQKRSYELSSQESRDSKESVPHLVTVGDLGSRPSAGLDSPVRMLRNGGKKQIQWDHYNINRRPTVTFDIQDAVSSSAGASQEQPATQKDAESRQGSGEHLDDAGQQNVESQPKPDELSVEEDHSRSKSEEESFFDNANFFQDQESAGSFESNFANGLHLSKESSAASDEAKDTSNSVEAPWHYAGLKSRVPVATSYSSMTTTFHSPVTPRIKDLLHPEIPNNDISMYVNNHHNPFSRSQLFNGRNLSEQVFVHRPVSEERPHYLRPLTPWHLPIHPHPHSRTVLHWQQAPAHSPIRRVIHHESRINHVVPTKDPFADVSWDDSRKIEYLKPPPPIGKTLYLMKRKTTSFDLKKLGRRRTGNFVVYVKNKRLQ